MKATSSTVRTGDAYRQIRSFGQMFVGLTHIIIICTDNGYTQHHHLPWTLFPSKHIENCPLLFRFSLITTINTCLLGQIPWVTYRTTPALVCIPMAYNKRAAPEHEEKYDWIIILRSSLAPKDLLRSFFTGGKLHLPPDQVQAKPKSKPARQDNVQHFTCLVTSNDVLCVGTHH